MSVINLSNTQYQCVVSESDFELLSRYRWRLSRQGYAVAQVNGVSMYMHRFIMNPEPTELVDHVDGVRLNNQRENLRCCTISENNRNRVKRICSNTSKYKGVMFDKSVGVWKCKVGRKYVGSYKTEEEAALAYDKAALEAFGEFAQINNIDPSIVVDNRKKKTSKYYGVHWFERDKGWKAQLVIDHKNTLLGVYSTEEEAAAAYNISAKVNRPDLPLNDVSDKIAPEKRTKIKGKYAGVRPQGNKWVAAYSEGGKRKYIGMYDTEDEAGEARAEFLKNKKGCV